MHRALDIPEILSCIVGAMDVAKPGDLLPLTRVSRAFSQPALDKLWEEPPLWDLAVLMNTHIWHEDCVQHMENGYLGDIMVTDHIMRLTSSMFFDSTTAFGRRFFQRAWRVRRLSLYTYSKKDQTRPERFVVGPEVLGLWATTPGTLPRLQDLHIDEGYLMKSPTHETLLPDFLSHHTLHTLALSSSHVFVALFERSQAALISACAELHEVMLEMISCGDDEGFEDGVAVRNRWTAWTGSIVAHARNVRHLRIELPVDYADLRVLSTAPALETLNATHIVDVPLVPVPFPSDAFLSLLELTLEDDTKGARLSCNVLSFRASSKLERCTLTINTSLNKDRCALLTAVCKHERLAHLLIDSSDWWEVDSSYIFQDMWLLLGHLRPSLYMQTLQFTMDPGESFPVNDLHIARVLQLYPNLRSWQRPNHCDLWAAMSLEEFMTVIKDRPEVRILPIAIECSDLPSALARESFGTHNYNMSFRILLRAFTDELRGAIWDLFPELRRGDNDIAWIPVDELYY